MKAIYSNHIIVFLVAILVLSFPAYATEDLIPFEGWHGPLEIKQGYPAKLSYLKKYETHKAGLNGRFNKRVLRGSDNAFSADLNTGYGRLFSPSNRGYQGFGFLTAKVDTGSRLRLNSSLGHYFPGIDGELFFSYRFLDDKVSTTLPNFGLLEDNILENSASASYTRLSGGIIRETSLNYAISSITGQGASRIISSDQSGGNQHRTTVRGGYGDTLTHALGAKIAFGSEALDSSLVSGIRAGLGLGYEYVAHDAFYDHPEETEQSVSAFASLQQETLLGSFTTSYKYDETASTWYAGYTFSGLELYFKDVQYGDRPANRHLGLKLKLDLDNLGNLFRKTKKSLFRKASFCYKGLDRIRHNGNLNSDQFTTRPRILETFGSAPGVM